APHPLDVVAELLQFGDDAVTQVALDEDAPVLDRAAGAAALLELAGQGADTGLVERDIPDDGDALALAALGLASDLERRGFLPPVPPSSRHQAPARCRPRRAAGRQAG